MDEKVTHTPGPWEIVQAWDEGRHTVVGFPHQIANAHLPYEIALVGQHVNAEFIVLACNSHDDLLAALKALADENLDGDTLDRNIAIARAAIAKAEGAGRRSRPMTESATPDPALKRKGELVIDGWGGRSVQPVTIEGETPTRYRVRAVGEELRLPSRGSGVRKILRSGTVLVPKYAVRF